MEIKNIEECKQYARQRLEVLRKVFAKAAIGDFSENMPEIREDDEFEELYVGIQTLLEAVRDKISNLEMEIGRREEVEQKFIARNKELVNAQKAMLNVLEDLQKTKSELEKRELDLARNTKV